MWGIWLDDAFYFSTGSLAAQNLAISPAITVHLESGSEVVIIEGVAEPISKATLVERVVNMYNLRCGPDQFARTVLCRASPGRVRLAL